MANFPVTIDRVNIISRSTEISAYLAMPQGIATAPGVIVLQEIFGVNTHIRAVTERIASMGYVAIAPALFDRVSPGFEVGYTSEDVTLGRSLAERTTAPDLLADIQGAIDYLKTLPQVRPDFGCIGFCFGGHVAYLAATLPDIGATASFYGRGITTFTPGGGEPSVSHTSDISGRIDLFFGMNDESIPPAHITEIDAALTQHQIPHQIWQYPGAEHGFCCDLRASYNSAAAEAAWQRVAALFQQL
jgi:carboxymethylenebutenolidase